MANKVVIAGVNTATLPKLSNDDIMALMKKVKAGDQLARDAFVVANLRLVLSVVQRFSGRSDKADDMFQVGCVGLMKAIDNFDESLNVRFSTYAVPMIIGEIRRFLRDNNSVRVSRSLRDIAYKSLQAKEELSKGKVEEPTIDDIAQYLNLPAKTINFALDAISETVSLSDPVYNDGSDAIELKDQIADLKDGEEISKTLALLGANKSVLKFEEIRVKREMNNKVNRLVNCETANMNKTMNASIEQIEIIRRLKQNGEFEKLEEPLKEIAELRLQNPSASLIELGKMLKTPIGKSGVNYRLKKVMEIGKKIDDNKK